MIKNQVLKLDDIKFLDYPKKNEQKVKNEKFYQKKFFLNKYKKFQIYNFKISSSNLLSLKNSKNLSYKNLFQMKLQLNFKRNN